jgi:mevalonate kinase
LLSHNNNVTNFYSSAPGKIILTGEHSVVFGKPAYACSINLRVHVVIQAHNKQSWEFSSKQVKDSVIYDLNQINAVNAGDNHSMYDGLISIMNEFVNRYNLDLSQGFLVSIDSEIPLGAGLGSSAALSVSFTSCLSKFIGLNLSKQEISDIAFLSEKIIHGTPSGIDNLITAHGGLLKFEAGDFKFHEVLSNMQLLIVSTGVERSTKFLVSKVREFHIKFETIRKIVDIIAEVSEKIFLAIQNNKLIELGELMQINHHLLNSIGVGHIELERAFWLGMNNGALGAKLTGAGGGGCLIVLVASTETSIELYNIYRENGFEVFQTEFTKIGVI